ncbi:hypothetical protein FGB62_156g010 [Gracilaria domingensis]|nr:hypothetical protein FGB62_156g010 [Gracilaria domingensis]
MTLRSIFCCFVCAASIVSVCKSVAIPSEAQAYAKLLTNPAGAVSRHQQAQFQRDLVPSLNNNSLTSSEWLNHSLFRKATVSAALSHIREPFRRLSTTHINVRTGSLSSGSGQQPRRSGAGLILETCETSSECRTPRRCLDMDSFESGVAAQCSSSSGACMCYDFQVCASSLDCDDGEGCSEVEPGTGLCSSYAAMEELDMQPISASENEEASISGLTGDSCLSDSDCRDDRRCESLESKDSCGPRDIGCICLSSLPLLCDSDSDCDNGESCQNLRHTRAYGVVQRGGDDDEDVLREARRAVPVAGDGGEQPAFPAREESGVHHGGASVHGLVRALRQQCGGALAFAGRAHRLAVSKKAF